MSPAPSSDHQSSSSICPQKSRGLPWLLEMAQPPREEGSREARTIGVAPLCECATRVIMRCAADRRGRAAGLAISVSGRSSGASTRRSGLRTLGSTSTATSVEGDPWATRRLRCRWPSRVRLPCHAALPCRARRSGPASLVRCEKHEFFHQTMRVETCVFGGERMKRREPGRVFYLSIKRITVSRSHAHVLCAREGSTRPRSRRVRHPPRDAQQQHLQGGARQVRLLLHGQHGLVGVFRERAGGVVRPHVRVRGGHGDGQDEQTERGCARAACRR